MPDTLLLGYGNVDRMDDGLAWHVLTAVVTALGGPAPTSPDEPLVAPAGSVDCQFALQLTPELAELVTQYRRVCFVDAHMSDVPEETRLVPTLPAFTSSPFTHHLTPAACLALAQALYGQAPQAVVASARGELFGFARELSPAAARRVPAPREHYPGLDQFSVCSRQRQLTGLLRRHTTQCSLSDCFGQFPLFFRAYPVTFVARGHGFPALLAVVQAP
jgi:Ni,Fe-hydrogenase maturation factor